MRCFWSVQAGKVLQWNLLEAKMVQVSTLRKVRKLERGSKAVFSALASVLNLHFAIGVFKERKIYTRTPTLQKLFRHLLCRKNTPIPFF